MRLVTKIILALLAAFLLAEAAFSLFWPIAHDEAPLFYEVFLMRAEGRIPYRDIFDFQMPGSYAVYYWLGVFSGFDDFRIRILDLLLLATLIIITFSSMHRFGWMPALAAGLLFSLKYIQGGPSMSLQREYLLLIFIALALWIALQDNLTPAQRAWLGLFFGLAATIKPHAAIGLVPILLVDIAGMVKSHGLTPLNAILKSGLPMFGGFLLPVISIIAWLGYAGALSPFLDIAQNYWPLYAQINGEMAVNAGAARWSFILDQLWRLGGNGWWILSAAVGIYFALRQEHFRKPVYLLIGLTISYVLYPAFSGQFFPYHWLPFLYIIILLSALCFVEMRWQTSLLLLVVILLSLRVPNAIFRQIEGKPIATASSRADQIKLYLAKHLEEGDTVQPLDWTGGTLLAMLETRAHIATPYVFDFYFYHHVSEPYIQRLRAKFMNDLRASPPRFIVEVTAIDRPWVSGEDTSREFPELRAFLEGNYSITIQKDDYVIYERR
jgi:hypothetical protein